MRAIKKLPEKLPKAFSSLLCTLKNQISWTPYSEANLFTHSINDIFRNSHAGEATIVQ